MMSALIFIGCLAGIAIGIYLRDWMMVCAFLIAIVFPVVAFFTISRKSKGTAKLKADLIERFAEQQEQKGGSNE